MVRVKCSDPENRSVSRTGRPNSGNLDVVAAPQFRNQHWPGEPERILRGSPSETL